MLNTGGRFSTEGIETGFEDLYNFLMFNIYFNKPVSISPNKSGQKRQKKCIGSEMSEKTMNRLMKEKVN
jgi:hypothetical protein